MKHLHKGKIFKRKVGPRNLMLRNLAESLILYEKIKTTETKAKVVRSKVEVMITRAKKDSLHNRRIIMKSLFTPNSVKKLFEVLGPRYLDRQGGYTRIYKTNQRRGDGAEQVYIELVK